MLTEKPLGKFVYLMGIVSVGIVEVELCVVKRQLRHLFNTKIDLRIPQNLFL